jgi:hypothetical protein
MISKNGNHGIMKQVIGHLESFLLLWRKLFGLPLCDMNQVHIAVNQRIILFCQRLKLVPQKIFGLSDAAKPVTESLA